MHKQIAKYKAAAGGEALA